MFHAHKTEFAELGWMGFFEAGGSEGRKTNPAAFCDLTQWQIGHGGKAS